MGFSDLMMVSQKSFRISELTLAIYEGVPILASLGLPKLLRSFPDEKFPPLPVTMMNLTAGF